MQLAVNELVVNSVTHGGGLATIRIWSADGGVYTEVADDGSAGELLIGRVPPDVDTERGRGLALVNYLCDLVRVYAVPGRTQVRIFMRY
jgi:anti-sigma regulatory factor (Ser/Thr protein kinase)